MNIPKNQQSNIQ